MTDAGGGADTRGIGGWIDVTKLGGLAALAPPEPPLEELRQRAVAVAAACARLGVNPKDAGRRRRYLDLIAP